MELKYSLSAYHLNRIVVLIVPLWNWNYADKLAKSIADSSNRTFMELK